jgi:hypothetical protein
MQPYLSAYYDSTRSVMESRLKTGAIKKPIIHVTDIDIDKKDNTGGYGQRDYFTDEERRQIRDFTPLS